MSPHSPDGSSSAHTYSIQPSEELIYNTAVSQETRATIPHIFKRWNLLLLLEAFCNCLRRESVREACKCFDFFQTWVDPPPYLPEDQFAIYARLFASFFANNLLFLCPKEAMAD